MSTTTKVISAVIAVLVIVGVGFGIHHHMVTTDVTQGDTVASTTPESTYVASSTDTSDASIQQDTANIDTQMKGLNQDTTNVDQSTESSS